MKAIVNKDMSHMFLDEQLNKGDIIEVEHYAYGKFYKIKEPKQYAGITIEKCDIDFLIDESQVYGNDCPNGSCDV